MRSLQEAFDPDVKPPSRLLMMLESRAFLEFVYFLQALPWLSRADDGDGHPVLVLPGFLAGDFSTRPMRGFLRKRGYVASPWKQGMNLGPDDAVEKGLIERLEYLHRRYGAKVSVVGWSLGGFYARELGRDVPELVRQVITLGTPFHGHLKTTNASWLYERISGNCLHEKTEELMARMQDPISVPTTSIFSASDGIVPWQHCVDRDPRAEAENIEVYGSHIGLGHNPLALTALADRLAQPEGEWAPFERSGARRVMFPDTEKTLRRLQRQHAGQDSRSGFPPRWLLEWFASAVQSRRAT